ncbi:MAG: hypothetical protein GDA56_09250 [Hormoscilla sp. GM7CHS1pb]|nr:hypothetical protein [Hormoscilla sp. GM7CHS1pb]
MLDKSPVLPPWLGLDPLLKSCWLIAGGAARVTVYGPVCADEDRCSQGRAIASQ